MSPNYFFNVKVFNIKDEDLRVNIYSSLLQKFIFSMPFLKNLIITCQVSLSNKRHVFIKFGKIAFEQNNFRPLFRSLSGCHVRPGSTGRGSHLCPIFHFYVHSYKIIQKDRKNERKKERKK